MTRKKLLTPIVIVLSLLLLGGCSTKAVNKLLGLASEESETSLINTANDDSTRTSATKTTASTALATDATSSATKVTLYGVAVANDATTSATQAKYASVAGGSTGVVDTASSASITLPHTGTTPVAQTNVLYGKITVINGRTITFEIATMGANQSTSSTTSTVDTITGSTKPITSTNTTTTVNPYVLSGKLTTFTLSDNAVITVIDSSTGAVVGTSFANVGVGSYIKVKLDASGKVAELQIIKLVVTQQTAVVPTPISTASIKDDHEDEVEEKEDNKKEDDEKEEEHEVEND